MSKIPRYILLSLALTYLFSCNVNAKTVFRRTDKISDNFKQLDLTPEEIDPDVAPEPQKIDTINPSDLSVVTSAPVEEVLEEIGQNAAANDIVDETLNEVDTGLTAAVTAAPVIASPAATTAAPSSTVASTLVTNTDDPNAINKYCKCTESHCNCCREFGLPLIPVRGPGCAKITYLGNQKMSVSIKYGDITLATRTISGKKTRPICVGLPGGYSQFCGKIYGLSKAKENFKACLGFELRADDDVEASLSVSCFKFGPEGLRVAESEPLPNEVVKDEDDDDDDIFGFGADTDGDDEDDDYEDDDDDDDVEEPEEADDADDDVDDDDDDDLNDDVEPPADADYGGFSLGGLIDELTDDDDDEKKPIKPAVTTVAIETPSSSGATRAVQKKFSVQSKGSDGPSTVVDVASETVVSPPASTTVATTTAIEASTIKSNTKNTKKNKKKKKAANDDAESDFAFEFLNGILDFFN